MKILVSSCLIGIDCKYSGRNNYSEKVMRFLKDKSYIPACPEQLGGLQTPRPCCELINGHAMDENGVDQTSAFKKGVEETLKIVEMTGCTHALLQKRSPSCGVYSIYDGSFSGKKIPGMGMTARALKKAGLSLMTEDDI
jgi:uncharacterized protein YbbK (DUF523 family)